MTARDELHQVVDRLPEPMLERVRQMLSAVMNPPSLPPELEKAQSRSRGREYQRQVEERFRQTRKPGTISSMGSSSFSGLKEGSPFGHTSFHYWDDKALVYQTLRFFSGQEFEQMERLAVSEDGTQLHYEQEISSGGRTVHREESFPFTGDRHLAP